MNGENRTRCAMGIAVRLAPCRIDVRLDTSMELLLEPLYGNSARKVLATIVRTAGSTYRKAGARMLIMGDGTHIGLLSGGCLEGDLQLHANQVLRSGVARAVEYDMRSPDDILFGIGAGCQGVMRVLLEPAGPGTRAAVALRAAGHATRAGLATSLVVVHDSTDVPLGTYGAESSLSPEFVEATQYSLRSAASRDLQVDLNRRPTRTLIQFMAPPPHLLICGAGPDARPVVNTALALGWRVTIVDHRPAYADSDNFPGADLHLANPSRLRQLVDLERCHAAVVMSHHLPSDASYLRELAESAAPDYVGLLGPGSRRNRLDLELGSMAERLRARLRSPVGLALGAVTPEAIALAIVSQIHAWLADCRELTTTASRHPLINNPIELATLAHHDDVPPIKPADAASH
jgi:xanthine dehydrogenase accessory factor